MIMIAIMAIGALILSIFGYFVFKQVLEDLAIYIAIAAVIGVIVFIFYANNKWNIFDKIKSVKK